MPLVFHWRGESACVDILIVDDQILENTEHFLVHLSSSDPAVDFTSGTLTTTVTITDNDSKSIGH